ncbi:MAG: PQQ-binding-like beta-propeller repeat protein [Armatimonadetes bacterium]|nr:PQQ-binding-like beta-propeller repeat protein [Armatimonadota bacterium]
MKAVRTTGVVLLALLCLTAGIGQAAMDYAAGPGTIGYALTQPDGARVSLTMVIIGRVDTAGVSVHEWWDKTTFIPALFSPPPALRPGQTIDLEGIMTTLPRGGRAVLCDRIACYLDRYGYLTPSVPPLKGLFDPSVWPTRGWLEVRPSVSLFSLSSLETTLLLDDPQPPSGGESPTASPLSFTAGTVPWAKSLSDGSPIALVGQIVTASRGQLGDYLYIEEPDRSAGIRVETDAAVSTGDAVVIGSGTVQTSPDGERFISATDVRRVCASVVRASGIINRDLGGEDFVYDEQDGSGQRGVVAGRGLNNIGLLVKIWGTVTQVNPLDNYFYIDDGSALSDGTQTSQVDNVGVRVVPAAGATFPETNDILELTGISSCMIPDGEDEPIRLLRVPAPPLHVTTNGDDEEDGLSWENAKLTVTAAIQAASSGQEIWVASGVYTENVAIDKAVGLYGGFGGTESSRNQRDWVANETTLDGDGADSVVTCSNVTGAVIDGFTIRNGYAEIGGGIKCANASPTIAHNTIIGNTSHGGVADARGGGIYCSGGSPIITDNVISSNHAASGASGSYGGGIYCDSCPAGRIANNTIVANTVPSSPEDNCHGGGVYISGNAPVIANNIIAFNASGIYATSESAEMLGNCVYNPVRYNYSWLPNPTGTNGNISADPLFADFNGGDYHLQSGQSSSPCIDSGSNDHVLSTTDMDGEYRVRSGTVDIGADETTGCISSLLMVSVGAVPAGSQALVAVYVFDPVNGVPVADCQVTLSVSGGTLVSPAGGGGYTGSDGRLTAIVEKDGPGYATVTASITSCSAQVSRSAEAFFYVPNDGWPMFMHDPQHTGASLAFDCTASQALGSPEWTAAVPTANTDRNGVFSHPNPRSGSVIFPHPYIDSSPVHAPGCPVIVGAWAGGNYSASTGYVAAFDPTTGDSEWRYPAAGYIGGVASTPAIFTVGTDKRVVVGSMDGRVYCLNAQTGALIWSYQTLNRAGTGNGKVLASPTVYQGRVYIGNESSRMYCLDGETTSVNGELEWSYDLPTYDDPSDDYEDLTGLSSVAIGVVGSEARVYVGSDNGRLYCLSTEDSPANRVIWTYPDPEAPDPFDKPLGCIESSPTVCDGTVYVGTSWYQGTDLVALDADTGGLVWSHGLDEEVRATCAALAGHIYIGVDTGRLLHRIRADDGHPVNLFDAGDYFLGSAALTASSSGLLYVGNDNGNFYVSQQTALSPPHASHATAGYVCSSPAISYAVEPNARWVYVVSRGDNGRQDGAGTLYAFSTLR